MKSMADIIDHTNSLCDASAWIRRLTDPNGFTKPIRGRRTNSVLHHRGVNALARYLGVTPAHVSQVLSGKRESRRVSAAALGRIQSEEIEMVR